MARPASGAEHIDAAKALAGAIKPVYTAPSAEAAAAALGAFEASA